MAYISYPYSKNPERCTEEVKRLTRKLIATNQEIVPIVPHIAFDRLFEHTRQDPDTIKIFMMELEAISRCDLLIYSSRNLSYGVLWELAIAKWLGKKLKTIEEILGDDKDEP
ncbi:MAG: hypothetical protein QXI39_00295 [Candidatus Bathyarchaeia archaeon]